ncbi:MAG: hypothetical protein KBD27_01700 [Candidatus Moranbacteria bacterium]|nr:hypothetical protein [Candidatus Moranbacteria bacterium]
MDTRTKLKPPPPMGHLLNFDPGELTLIKGRSDQALAQGFQHMMAQKAMVAILWRHPGVESEQVEIVHLDCPTKIRKHWGMVLEVLYRIKGAPGSYRHVFHFMLSNGDQSGRLFTQSWRFIAK